MTTEAPTIAAKVYQDINFGGKSQDLYEGDYPDLTKQPIGNDTISSVIVTPGYVVILYEHTSYGGEIEAYLADSERDLRREEADNAASSIKVRKLLSDKRAGIVYRDINYLGLWEPLYLTDYPNCLKQPIGNDTISSVQVTPGYVITLFSDVNYGLPAFPVVFDTPDLSKIPALLKRKYAIFGAYKLANWNGVASSIKVYGLAMLKFEGFTNFLDSIAAGLGFNISPIIKNIGGPGDAKLYLGDAEVWAGKLRDGESISLPIPLTMPWDDAGFTFKCTAPDEEGTWVIQDVNSVLIRALFANFKFGAISFPPSLPAGQAFPLTPPIVNQGVAGPAELWLGNTKLWSGTLAAGESQSPKIDLTMPWNDLAATLSLNTLGRGKQWVTSDTILASITALFPLPKFGAISFPPSLPAGGPFSLTPPIVNQGVAGPAELWLGNTKLWSGTLAAGESQSPKIDLTMPWNDLAATLSLNTLGRGKQWVTSDTILASITALFPMPKFAGIDFPALVPAGGPFSIVSNLTNQGATGPAELYLGDTKLWSGNLVAGQASSVKTDLAMPWDDLLSTFTLRSFGRGQQQVITDSKGVNVRAAFPMPKFIGTIIFSDIIAAGEAFSISPPIVNQGVAGPAKLYQDGNELGSWTLGPLATASPVVGLTMPWDDALFTLSLKSLGRGQAWVETDRVLALIKAGFPSPQAKSVSSEEKVKPGSVADIISTIVNRDYNGNIGVRAYNQFTGNTTDSDMPRVARDQSASFKYSCEMPGVEELSVVMPPISLARGRAIVEQAPSVVTITPIDALFVRPNQSVRFYGGKDALQITGFIAGEGLEFAPGTQTPVTLPADMVLPVGAYPFLMTLGVNEVKTINVSSLRFLKVRASRGIAVIEGTIVANKDTTDYQYSPVKVAARAAAEYLPALPLEFGLLTPPLPRGMARKMASRESMAEMKKGEG